VHKEKVFLLEKESQCRGLCWLLLWVFLEEGENGFVCEWILQLAEEKKERKMRKNKKIIRVLWFEDRDLFILKQRKTEEWEVKSGVCVVYGI
jgi:hypothetical protein